MELTKEQVGKIDQFLKQKGVKHLDLRLELIDHLSTEIEDLLQRVSVETFDQAFQKIETKYSTFLLKNIKKNKQVAMHGYWRGRFLEFWKSYFTLPKIAITILLFIACLSIAHIPFRKSSLAVHLNTIMNATGFCIPVFLMIKSLIPRKRFLILEGYYHMLMGPFILFSIVYQLPDFLKISPFESTWFIVLLSFTNSIFLIALVGNITSFRFWIKEEIEKAYPLMKNLG